MATESSSGSPHWVDNADQLAREEVFGPVLAVIPFDGDDEAVAAANDTEFGLVAYVFTQDVRRALRVSEQLHVGMLGLNKGLVS
ncbi:MAG: succinate-semialdehyde dehydrogenase / glutarate-semialdehyde dehydrogenase, partial [Pseudonocardiales bacterium]|nr:succinate-semialdehyde dehydrogenase / glutarate-semialdehyde dehydrogenase [Pseudonocardiales bacterium]